MINNNINPIDAISSFISLGSYQGIGGGSDVDSVEAVFGMAEHVVMKKGQKTMKYSWGNIVFENKQIHQMMFSFMTPNDAQQIKQMLSTYQNKMIDRVEGYFRYFKVGVSAPKVQEILFNTNDIDDSTIISVAVVFPDVDTVEMNISLTKSQYDILKKISSSKRETMTAICSNIIEKYITEHDNK